MHQHFYKLIVLTSLLMGMAGSAWSASQAFQIGVAGTGEDFGADGTFERLQIDSGAGYVGLRTVASVFSEESRFAFEFDLTALPAGAIIDSASLILRGANGTHSGQTLLSGYVGNGAIDLVQDMTGGMALVSFVPSGNADTLDVSSFVQGVFGPSQKWVGFNLRQSPLGPNLGLWGGPPPFQLSVEYSVSAVPEPQAYLLMLLGLGVMAGVAKQRRRNA